jgi:hypothetical protein
MIAPLDGQPWVFSFSGLSAGIAKITVDFTGSKLSGIGLAFNNFDPNGAAVPEPAGWLLAAIGLVSVNWCRCHRSGPTTDQCQVPAIRRKSVILKGVPRLEESVLDAGLF